MAVLAGYLREEGNFISSSGYFKAWLWLAGAADGLNFLRQASENMSLFQSWINIDQDVPLCRCPIVAVGDDQNRRPAGIFAGSDHGRLGRMGGTAGPQPGLSHTLGTDLAGGFPWPRPLPPSPAPAGPGMAVG